MSRAKTDRAFKGIVSRPAQRDLREIAFQRASRASRARLKGRK